MLKHPRLLLPLAALAALAVAGCNLVSGQFVLTYNFRDHGFDPITVNAADSVAGVRVDLKSIPAYREHKKDLKDITDLAVVGRISNLDASAPVDVEVWLVPKPGMGINSVLLTTDAQVRAAGYRVWGPLHLGPGEVRDVDWNASSQLFTSAGRQVVMAQTKGDGRFDLYTLGSNGYHYKVENASIIAVIAGGH